MSKIIYPSQQFNLQQKIARKSISEFRPKIQQALQHDFNKAAQLVHELGAQQVVNQRKTFFSTEFQRSVWAALQKIPRGTLRTYLDVAKMIGKPKSVRAVANAIGANPICVFIPCHRGLS